MVLKLQKVENISERELEKLVSVSIDSVEKGLVYLDHQINAAGKYIDILAADDNGILVVIELKLGEDDGMLIQALDYLGTVQTNRDRLAKQYEDRAKIDPEEDPRVILVAGSFSERLRRAVRYVEPQPVLVEHQVIKADGDLGLVCKEVVADTDEGYSAPASIDTVLSRIVPEKLRRVCRRVMDDIRQVGNDMDEPKASGTSGIRLKCKNRLVARLYTRRKFFWLAYLWGDEWKWHEVYSLRDWTAKRAVILKAYRKTYLQVGGSE